MRTPIARLARCDRGATAIEYGLVLALIALVGLVGVSALGSATGGLWNDWSGKFAGAVGGK